MNETTKGFTAGVLTIEWNGTSILFQRRMGDAEQSLIHSAQIVSIDTSTGTLLRDAVHRALFGLVVRGPDGELATITAVESFATMSLGTGSTGSIGLVLQPLQ